MITKPVQFDEAISFILNKDPNQKEWVSEDWANQKPAVRVRSFFSAQVESARFLDRAQGFLFDYMAKTKETVVNEKGERSIALRAGGRADFIRQMREFMISEGMATDREMREARQTDLTDIKSSARLGLIFDTNLRQAYGYGNWRQGMSPAVRRRFPAAMLVRKRGVKVARPRHAASEGEVRLKTDYNYWSRYQNDPEIGGFSVPWEPYGFNSGVGQRDVAREDAIGLGLIEVDKEPRQPEGDQPELNDGLSASIATLDPNIKARLIKELKGISEKIDTKDAVRQSVKQITESKGRIYVTEDRGPLD